jgi:hypothetical protein
LSEFRRLPIELDHVLSQPSPAGQYSINLVINPPSGLNAFTAEFQKISENPRVIAAIAASG